MSSYIFSLRVSRSISFYKMHNIMKNELVCQNVKILCTFWQISVTFLKITQTVVFAHFGHYGGNGDLNQNSANNFFGALFRRHSHSISEITLSRPVAKPLCLWWSSLPGGGERAWLCFWEKLFRGRRTHLLSSANSVGRLNRRRENGKGTGSGSWEQGASPESIIPTSSGPQG